MPIKHKNPQLNNELTFLIACCQTNPSTDDIKFIQNTLSTINYQSLTKLANQHGILPLLYKTLKKLSENDSAFDTNHGPFLADLKSLYMQISQRNMLMSAELIRIIKLLEKNNIETLSFKGPTLAQLAYGNITLRQFGDLDILIKPKNFLQVHKLLIDKMYDTKYNYDRAVEKVLELIPDHMFIGVDNHIIIEIHNKLFASNFPIIVPDDIFWENATSITINNKNIPTFTKEYLLFYLCLHGSKHLFSRISWILDMVALIDSASEDFDWELFQQIVHDHHLDTMIAVGLHLSSLLFQAKIPKTVLQKINTNKKSLKIAKSIINNISENPADSERFTFTHLRMFDSWSEKIKYTVYLFKPTILDYQIFETNYKSEILYYILRPWHIFYRLILNIFQRNSK